MLLRSLRFAIPVIAFAILFGQFLPDVLNYQAPVAAPAGAASSTAVVEGLTIAKGFAGFVTCVLLGTLFAFAFRGLRVLEAMIGRRYGRTQASFEHIWLIAPLVNCLLVALTLGALTWAVPSYVKVLDAGTALKAAFWLTVFGQAITAPALSRVLDNMSQPIIIREPAPNTTEPVVDGNNGLEGSATVVEEPKFIADDAGRRGEDGNGGQ